MITTPQLDIQSQAFKADPFAAFAQLREHAPVVWVEVAPGHGMWFITRFEEAIRVLKDLRFVVDPSNILPPEIADQMRMPTRLGLERSVAHIDGVDHNRLRALVSNSFTPRLIEGLRPRIQEIADSLLDKVQANGQMDLIDDYSFPLPINVISGMLGVPVEDQNQIREWSAVISRTIGTDGGAERKEKLGAFADYIDDLIAIKRQHPQNDLISQLSIVEAGGDRLNDAELKSMISLLIFAGHETTSNLIGNGMIALFMNPDQLDLLKANSVLIPSALEELLRFCGPTLTSGARFATEDIEIGGQLIRKMDTVQVVLASADRDPKQFINPEDLDISRTIDRQLAFGHGVHFCLGAPLARLEGQIAFETLLRRLPDIHLAVAPESIVWRGGLLLRGPQNVPVAFSAQINTQR